MDWFNLPAAQGTLKSLLQLYNSALYWYHICPLTWAESGLERFDSFQSLWSLHREPCWQPETWKEALEGPLPLLCHQYQAGTSRNIFLTTVIAKIWRREGLTTPVFLPGKFHRQRSLVNYSPWGCKESDTTEGLILSLFIIAKVKSSLIFGFT